jgi:hypothetical protein
MVVMAACFHRFLASRDPILPVAAGTPLDLAQYGSSEVSYCLAGDRVPATGAWGDCGFFSRFMQKAHIADLDLT